MTDAVQEFSGALLLIIDDEETQRLLTRDNLEHEGFRVVEASNGEDGLRLIRELRPDLVLLDVMMPGIDGFEVCRQLRADPAICHTPVIIVTGCEDTDDVDSGFASGATDFLTKPVIWNLLPSRVRFVLRTSKLEQELRSAREEAERASEAKSALLSTMGHELRTPLNAIIGFTGLMKQAAFGPMGSPQYDEFVVDIHSSGLRLLEAINAILEIVSCESEKVETDRSAVSVVEIVDSVLKQIVPEAQASSIQVVNNVIDSGIDICGNEEHLKQALLNLVSNAVKFTEEGGIVRLDISRPENGDMVFIVSDNGIGISAEDLVRVQQPFEQADSSLARNYEGLGLGIPLSIAIARSHGGAIDYESEPGQGTTVRMTLPAERLTISQERPSTARTA